MNLQQLISIYRRGSDEVIGAVRLSAIETIAMEQMPGGKFQITMRTTSQDAGFISVVLGSLVEGQDMLAKMRSFVGGESDENPAEAYVQRRDDARDQASADRAEAAHAANEQAARPEAVWSPPK